jgi:ABC-type amino acid transport substrate-binding protein
LYISGEPVTGEQYAVVALKESGELLRALDDALEDMRRDGSLGELEEKWLGP